MSWRFSPERVELGGKWPSTPPQTPGYAANDGVSVEMPDVVGELILALMRKGMLTEVEAEKILR